MKTHPTFSVMNHRYLLARVLLVVLLPASQVSGAATAPGNADEKAARQGMQTARPGKAGMVQGSMRTSKTSLDIRVDYRFDTPAAGSTTEVRLKVSGVETGRPLTVEVAPGTGLRTVRSMPGGMAMQSVASAEHTLSVAPDGDGLHYIHVFLRAGNMSEALAIAMPVGKNASPAKAVEPRTLPDGRRIKSLPSQP